MLDSVIPFNAAFTALTGKAPFPWQGALYERLIAGDIPKSCNLPTGLGKTSVIAIWLIALATHPNRMPRRLVYVVNRRTVVDQTTDEAEKLRINAELAGVPVPAISTLRGQFADNREWSADPSRPAIICGTVDMIGSRLLFSGYGVGFKGKPLHAGFLGQDVLLVHDEAHLEPAFQHLLTAIEKEQTRCKEFGKFHVMELTATPRGTETPFQLTEEERRPPAEIPSAPTEPIHYVWRRTHSKKALVHHPIADEKKGLVPKIVERALCYKDDSAAPAVLVFVRTVEAVGEVVTGLKKGKVEDTNVLTLTGTMRGLERDRMANENPVFARFKKDSRSAPQPGTVFLICTSAGEVGVDMSADHLICDLATFDSMAQRFGRVNRYGDGDALIEVVHPTTFETKDIPFDSARERTLEFLSKLRKRSDGQFDACPSAMGELVERVIREGIEKEQPPISRQEAIEKHLLPAFAPPPTIMPTSDILFDAWALTTIRDKLPGRPPVAPYLHGIAEWQPPETHVAWREEVSVITGQLLEIYPPADLLEDYPLKPHEMLRDTSSRVFDRLKKLAADPETPVWIIDDAGTVKPSTLGEIQAGDKEDLYSVTVLLPPEAGGLSSQGMLDPTAKEPASDVADEWYVDKERTLRQRERKWGEDVRPPAGMRRSRPVIDSEPDEVDADESSPNRYWHWFERIGSAGEGKPTADEPYELQKHLVDAEAAAADFMSRLHLAEPLCTAVIVAARYHDLGKDRTIWQRSIGNFDLKLRYAKSGGSMRPLDLSHYRHEFGSLLDIAEQPRFRDLPDDVKELVLHLIAAHHGRARPHFPRNEAFDPEPRGRDVETLVSETPRRFARLQRQYGRWGLAYLESLVRAADILASQKAAQGDKP